MPRPARKPIFPGYGVLTAKDSSDETVLVRAIRGAYERAGVITVKHGDGKEELFALSRGYQQDGDTGRISFTATNGNKFLIRELSENDGLWLSAYKTMLPVRALEDLIDLGKTGESVELRGSDLNAPDESLEAYALDDSPYVVGVLYTTRDGMFYRTDGDWAPLAPDDETFADNALVVFDIDPDKADEFLEIYDRNYVSVDDMDQYESADGDEEVEATQE